MTDTSTPQMGPNVRRFVRSAWLLLFAQLAAAILAIGATGWAAFYVADLRAERDDLRAQIEEFTGGTVVDPMRNAPMTDTVESVDDGVIVVEPAESDEAAPTEPPSSQSDRPVVNPSNDAAVQRPAAVSPRPTPTQPSPPRTERPATATSVPPRRNTRYPGGLPGDGTNNAEPPLVQDRYNPNTPVGNTPTLPDIDLEGLAREVRDRTDNAVDTDDGGPNFQRRN